MQGGQGATLGARAGRDLWTDYIDDYVTFHKMELESGDVDPVYYALQALAAARGGTLLTAREMALLSFLHVAFYDYGSALRAMTELECRANFDMIPRISHLHCGTERRGHRNSPELVKHLAHLFTIEERYGGLDQWALQFRSHGEIFGALASIYGNGRWAAYKASELLSWSLRSYHPATARAWMPDNMGHAHSSGPRVGLTLLSKASVPKGHSALDVRRLDALSALLVEYLQSLDVTATMATVETTLCDFGSMVKGRYYPGHDIHQMAEQVRRATQEMGMDRLLYDRDILGAGWVSLVDHFGAAQIRPVNKPRKRDYLDKRTMTV